MQRKFLFRLKDKTTASGNERENGSTRFKSGDQLSRKPVNSSKVKEKESLPRWHMNPHLLSFLSKKNRWKNFMRGLGSKGNKVAIRLGEVRRKGSLGYLVRIPSKILVSRLKLKMSSLIKKKVTKRGDDDHGNEDTELCTKRILMGVRCRPLSSPGTLSYGTDGLFLPRDTSFTRPPRHP